MLRTAYLVALTFLASITWAQDLTKRCSYTTRAVPLHIALESLSKSTGIHLECSPDLDQEPIILRLKDVPVKVAMDKIAYVFAGEWKKIGDRYRLIEGKAADDAHAQCIKDKAEAFRKGLSDAVATAHLDQRFTVVDADKAVEQLVRAEKVRNNEAIQAARTLSPAGRMLLRVLQRMDPAEIATVQPNHRMVFSNTPTSLQLPLPDIEDLIDSFEGEQPTMNDSITKANVPEEARGYVTLLQGNTSVPVSKVVVSITGFHGIFGTDIWMLGNAGELIARGTCNLTSRDLYLTLLAKQQDAIKDVKNAVALGPIASDILPAINSQEYFHWPKQPTKDAFLNPTVVEPLSIATSDIVLGLADKMDVDVAFLAPDSSELCAYTSARSGKVTFDAFKTAEAIAHQMTIESDDKWVIGKPIDPIETRSLRLSRPALEKFLKSIDAKRKVNLEDQCAFAYDATPNVDFTLAHLAVRGLFNGDFPDRTYDVNLASFALVGSITPQQASNMVDGVLNIPVSELSDEQKQLLLEWSLTSQSFFPMKPSPGLDTIRSQYDNDATEVLGNGFPAGSYIEIDDASAYTFSVRRKGYQGKWALGGIDVDRMAKMQAESELPDKFPDSLDYDLRTVRIDMDRNILIEFVVNGNRQLQQFEQQGVRVKDEIAFDQAFELLPSPLRIDYAKALEKYRAQFRSGHFS